jgi:Uma2 family endonuclease
MVVPSPSPIIYPESDGKPMADNTLQWDWIVSIKLGIADIFRDDPNVFIAGNLLWYPVEGEPTIRADPDVLVALGRPKGYRGSYKQWEEGHAAPQVVFEILSELNTPQEMQEKCDFYREHGVQEYFEFDPHKITLKGWVRKDTEFHRVWAIQDGWTSPLLGVHFRVDGELFLTKPNGERFLRADELTGELAAARRNLITERQRSEVLSRRAEDEGRRAEEQRQQAEEQRQRAEDEKRHAEEQRQRAEDEKRHAEEQRQRAEEQSRRAEIEKQRAEDAKSEADEIRHRNEQLEAELARLRALLAERGGGAT